MSGAKPKRTQSKVRLTVVASGQKSSKNKNIKSSLPRQRAARSKRSSNGPSVRLSPCASEYAQAIVDPFDGPLACVPSSYPPLSTFKSRVWARGSLSIGSAGYGFIMVKPNNLFSNTATGLCFSATSYAQSGFPVADTDIGVFRASTNAPFTSAQIGTTALLAQFRIVALGVRTWYTGTELNLSGEMVALRQPDNVSLLGTTYTQMLSFPAARRVAITSERLTIDTTWIPTKPRDLEFQDLTINDDYCLGIVVNGVASSASAFGFEVFGICEYIGSNVPSRTLSPADPEGFAAVLTAAQQTGDTWYGDAREAARSLLSNAASALAGMSSTNVGRAAIRVGLNYAGMGGLASALPSLSEGKDEPAEHHQLRLKGRDEMRGLRGEPLKFTPEKEAEQLPLPDTRPKGEPMIFTAEQQRAIDWYLAHPVTH